MRNWHPRSSWFSRSLIALVVALGTIFAFEFRTLPASHPSPKTADLLALADQTLPVSAAALPPLQPHPLPQALTTLNTPQSGDYFDEIQPTIVGYLVWSQFPVTVYIQPPTASDAANPFNLKQAQGWVDAVSQAVQEWHQYLPLEIVSHPEGADITVLRSPPPIRLADENERTDNQDTTGANRGRPTLAVSRARSAETRFELYARQIPAETELDGRSTLAHRFTIRLRPDQANQYLQAAARHELGHALGIWGHSPSQTDALYFAQVRDPAPISPRDINTLKRIYKQPTRLGWVLPKEHNK